MRKKYQRHTSVTKSKGTNILVCVGKWGVDLEAVKLETLNIRDKDSLLDVKSWLENLLYDHGKCEVRLQSYTQNAHFPPLDI